jgi:hypothetical protein
MEKTRAKSRSISDRRAAVTGADDTEPTARRLELTTSAHHGKAGVAMARAEVRR